MTHTHISVTLTSAGGGLATRIGLESATSQHSNNFKNSKTGSTWIQFLYGSKHISSGLTHSMVM